MFIEIKAMPYTQNPRDLLRHSQDTVNRVNSTDLNIEKITVLQAMYGDDIAAVKNMLREDVISDTASDITEDEKVRLEGYIATLSHTEVTSLLRELS